MKISERKGLLYTLRSNRADIYIYIYYIRREAVIKLDNKSREGKERGGERAKAEERA